MRRSETMPLTLRIVLILILALIALVGWALLTEAVQPPANDVGVAPPWN